jgi:hypothetical protein
MIGLGVKTTWKEEMTNPSEASKEPIGEWSTKVEANHSKQFPFCGHHIFSGECVF